MKYIKEHPKAKKWTIPAIKFADGTVGYLKIMPPPTIKEVLCDPVTGDLLRNASGRPQFTEVPNPYFVGFEGAEKIEVKNFIFEAAIRPKSWTSYDSFNVQYEDVEDPRNIFLPRLRVHLKCCRHCPLGASICSRVVFEACGRLISAVEESKSNHIWRISDESQ